MSKRLGLQPTPGVRLTKLSKALHVKRPELLPLYDNYIWCCYGLLGNVRVQSVKGRSNADFMRVAARGPEMGWRLADEARRGCPHN